MFATYHTIQWGTDQFPKKRYSSEGLTKMISLQIWKFHSIPTNGTVLKGDPTHTHPMG